MESDSKIKDMREALPPDTNGAKRNFIETAQSIDWLMPLRQHPFATVGISAAIGAVAAANPKTVDVASRFIRTLIPLVEKGANAFLQAQAAKITDQSKSECSTIDPEGVH